MFYHGLPFSFERDFFDVCTYFDKFRMGKFGASSRLYFFSFRFMTQNYKRNCCLHLPAML